MNHKLIIFLGLMFISMITFAQTKNSATEVKDYREVDGKIILDVIVNGGSCSVCVGFGWTYGNITGIRGKIPY